jgi:hypothetical protein
MLACTPEWNGVFCRMKSPGLQSQRTAHVRLDHILVRFDYPHEKRWEEPRERNREAMPVR